MLINSNLVDLLNDSPLNLSSSILELKRFGRFEEKSTFDGEGPFVLRGRWTFDGDSVRLLVQGELRDVFTPHQGGLLHRNGNFYYQKIKD